MPQFLQIVKKIDISILCTEKVICGKNKSFKFDYDRDLIQVNIFQFDAKFVLIT